MEEFPDSPGERAKQFGLKVEKAFDPRQTEKLLVDLTTLLKHKKSSELISTFQAGTIPIILDVLARDTSNEGQQIVTALLQQIEVLKKYYIDRESKQNVEVPVNKQAVKPGVKPQ